MLKDNEKKGIKWLIMLDENKILIHWYDYLNKIKMAEKCAFLMYIQVWMTTPAKYLSPVLVCIYLHITKTKTQQCSCLNAALKIFKKTKFS